MYPTEEELQTISNWPRERYAELMDYIRERWEYANSGYWKQEDNAHYLSKTVRMYYLSTAGWSGNEDIIRAMRENFMFWSICWFSSERGGHYKFIVPNTLF